MIYTKFVVSFTNTQSVQIRWHLRFFLLLVIYHNLYWPLNKDEINAVPFAQYVYQVNKLPKNGRHFKCYTIFRIIYSLARGIFGTTLSSKYFRAISEQETPDETSIFFRPFFFTSKNKTQRKNIQEHKIDNKIIKKGTTQPIRLFYRT